jgi:hypothetical protein
VKDALFTGFWISLLTGSITWGATYSFGYGLAAFLVGFLAFAVGPALYEKGKAHESKETADILAQKPKTGADYSREELERTLDCSPRPCIAGWRRGNDNQGSGQSRCDLLFSKCR